MTPTGLTSDPCGYVLLAGVVTFEDGTTKEAFLSTKAFMQLIRMKAGPAEKAKPKPATATDFPNGVIPRSASTPSV